MLKSSDMHGRAWWNGCRKQRPKTPFSAAFQRYLDTYGYFWGRKRVAYRCWALTATIARTAFKDAGKPSGLVALNLGVYGATMIPSQEYTGKYPNEFSDFKGLLQFSSRPDHMFC